VDGVAVKPHSELTGGLEGLLVLPEALEGGGGLLGYSGVAAVGGFAEVLDCGGHIPLSG
jgi:hypothetical protein